MIKKLHACNKINFSSNISEVIRTVLIFLFVHKILRFHKHKKSTKNTKSTKSIQAQLSKSIKCK